MLPIDEKLKLLKPAIGEKKVMTIRQMYMLEDDFREKKEIENLIDLLISKKVKTSVEDEIILSPPDKTLCSGDIYVGQVEYLKKQIGPFYLKLQDINRHMGIFGSTGSGKTTMALNLIHQLHRKKIPFLIFDWEKSYRNLAKKYDDVIVFTLGSDVNPLYLNPLNIPPGISKEEFSKSLIALIAIDYLSGPGSDTILLKYLNMAFQDHEHPTFNHLKEITIKNSQKRMRGRTMLWAETVGRIITSLSTGTAGQVFCSDKQYPIDQLLTKNIVLELGGIQSPRDRKFIVHLLVNYLFLWLQYHGIESEHLKQVIIFEEFHNIAMKSQEENIISTLFRECRKYGLGLLALDQTPSEISNAIFGNMNCKASFSLGTSKDISAMAKAMNLKPGTNHYPGMLNVGHALINVKQRHSDSFLISSPYVDQTAQISDTELKKRIRRFSGQIDSYQSVQNQNSSFQTSQQYDISPKLEALEKVVLTSIAERPLSGVQIRTDRLGFHPTMMVSIHDKLMKKGIIKPVTVNRIKLFEITEHGKDICQTNKIKIPARQTRGGLEHSYWIDQTLRFLRNLEFEPVPEQFNIDIVSLNDKLAIEIETGNSDILRNLEKLKNLKVCRNLYILATTKIAESKIKKFQSQYPHIKFMTVKEFIKLSKDKILSTQ